MIQQKDIKVTRSWDMNLEEYTNTLFIFGDPVEKRVTKTRCETAVVTILGDGDYRMDLYRFGENIPDVDIKDENTFVLPIHAKL